MAKKGSSTNDKNSTRLINTAEMIQTPWKRALYKVVQPSLERFLGIKKLQKWYDAVAGAETPGEMSKLVYEEGNINYKLPSEEELKRLRAIEGPMVVVANHPFGGIEAIMLIILLDAIRPGQFKVMANYMLAALKGLQEGFIMVDPFERGNSSQFNRGPIREALGYLKEGGLLGVFPSGEVASYNTKSRKIQEPEWSHHISKLIQKTGAHVVPMYFHGYNSLMFQLASVASPKLRTSFLIREFVNKKNRSMDYQLGHVITPSRIKEFEHPEALTAYLKSKTYLLGSRYTKSKFRFDLIHRREKRGLDKEEAIIDAVPPEELEAIIHGLPKDAFLKNYKEVDVYTFNGAKQELLLRELGRLREITFRGVGEGTGKALDIDKFDAWYDHIIIWHREAKEIVGSYRVGRCDEIFEQRGLEGLYTSTLFYIQPDLFKQLSPALELGRSFVRKEYQRHYWSLLMLWTGIGHYIAREPRYHTLIGPVSISGEFHSTSKDILVKFLTDNNLSRTLREYVKPRNPYPIEKAEKIEFFNSFSIKDLHDVQDLIDEVESTDLKVPILIKHYLKMGGKILAFNVDPEFSDVLDAMMYIDLRETEPQMLKKYMSPQGFAVFADTHNLENR